MRDDLGSGEIGPTTRGLTSAFRQDPSPESRAPSPELRMPAEWEPHDATWIAWPHHEPDWPGKLGPIPWVYAEIVRALHRHEPVEILCHDDTVRDAARETLAAHGVVVNEPRAGAHRVRLHVAPNDR